VLATLASQGLPGVSDRVADLTDYLDHLIAVDPTTLDRDGSLAYWINLYNALALDLARRTNESALDSVLRQKGGFSRRIVTIAGENLSIDGIEHGKIRRFKDPRIHAALICGSTSCPTLRTTAFRAETLDEDLDDQLRQFLALGGIEAHGDSVELSRVFLWYGADFTRPRRMPTLLPTRRKKLLAALRPWINEQTTATIDATEPRIAFQSYDWSLRCAVQPPPT